MESLWESMTVLSNNLSTPTSKHTQRRFPYSPLHYIDKFQWSFDKRYSTTYYSTSSTVNGSALITLHITDYPSVSTTLFPSWFPFNSFLLFLLTQLSPELLDSCIKIGFKCTRLVNAPFPCLQIYQSAYNILLSSALFIVAEYSLVVFQGYFSPYLQSKR